jgi:hypothetical protein
VVYLKRERRTVKKWKKKVIKAGSGNCGICREVLTPCKILCGSNCTLDSALSSGSLNHESDARLVRMFVGGPDIGTPPPPPPKGSGSAVNGLAGLTVHDCIS